MLTIILRDRLIGGQQYAPGDFFDTSEITPRLEALLLDQRVLRAAQIDEQERHRDLQLAAETGQTRRARGKKSAAATA
jgi:hypothetical protein